MIHLAYLASLLIALFGMAVIDYRFKIAFFHDWRRSAIVIGAAIVVFVLWDLAGIGLGIFSKGASMYSLEFELLPELPIEELLFLFLLNYISLMSYLYLKRKFTR